MSSAATPETSSHAEVRVPPVAWFSVSALVAVIVGGILMASYAPRSAPRDVPLALLIVGVASLATSMFLLVRIDNFGWTTFWKVFNWALLAYVITAAIIEFAFVRDQTRGSSLVIVTLMLVVFALSVPVTIAFTTARYADPD